MLRKFAQFITAVLILSLGLPLPVQAATGFTVSGKVSTSGGALAGVTLTLGTITAITNASGNYTISNVPANTTADLTPSKTGYTFNPVSIPLTVTANRTAQNFTATQLTFSISGKVTKPDSSGLQGVSVFGVLTDVNGNYTIPNRPYGSTTNLTPTKGGFTFSPPSISVPAITANVTGQDFTANSIHLYTVSGTITTGGGPVGGVKVTLDSIYSDTTNGNGNFAIHNVPDGTSGDLVPSLAGYTFAPASLPVASLTGDLTAQNFVATQITFNISGSVSDGTNPLSGVKVAISGTPFTTNSGADGSYTLANVPYGTSGALTPTASEYAFTPLSINIASLTDNLSAQNFIGSKLYVVSGKVTVDTSGGAGLPNVVVSLGTHSDTTAADGSFNIQNNPGGTSGNVTPSLAGYTFNPTNIPITNLQSDVHQNNFIATLSTYNISGIVTFGGNGLPGATVAISGTAFSTISAADGSYTLANVPFGTSGNLTPSLAGYVFAPVNIPVANLAGDLTGKNFVGTKVFTLSGKVTTGTSGGPGLANVLVSFGSYSDTTVSNGTYSIQNIPAGTSASLIPSLAGYTFSPTNIPINDLQADTGAQDFVATLNTYTITGHVTDGSNGIGNVTISLGAFSTSTAADGSYSLGSVPYGSTGALTPSLAGFVFAPPTISIPSLTANLSNKNFVASSVYDISGKVTLADGTTGVANVVVSLGTFSDLSAADGSYSILNVPAGTTGNLTPVLSGYTFSPAPIHIAALASNLTGQNFTATPVFSISGHVTSAGNGLAGVVVALGSYQATTDGAGSYTIINVPGGTNGSLVPTKNDFNFTPPSITVPSLTQNLTGQDFSATGVFSIAGTVISGSPLTGLAGVTVALGPYNALTASNGAYKIISIPPGTKGLLTASKVGYTFKPNPISVSALAGDLNGKNFVATTIKFAISGKVTLNGVGLKGVSLHTTSSGLTIANVVTNSTGAFTIPNLPSNHVYTVTPVLAGYTFATTNYLSPVLVANQIAPTFVATLLFENISGQVSGLGGTIIQIRYGSGKTQIVSTAADGTYAINGLPENIGYTLQPVNPITPKFIYNPTKLVIPAGNGDKSDANFVTTWNISGVVSLGLKSMSGVEVDATINSTSLKAVTNSKGAFSFSGAPFGASVTISAKKYGFSFIPAVTYPVIVGVAPLSGQNFSAALLPQLDNISGAITLNGTATPLANVLLTLKYKGDAIFTTRTAKNGTYNFPKLVADSGYVVTPALANYTFTPGSQNLDLTGGSQTGQNFSATHVFKLSGRIFNLPAATTSVDFNIGVNGGGLVLTPSAVDSLGRYAIPNLTSGATYLIEPSLGLHTFNPPSSTFITSPSTTQVVKNFTFVP